MSHIFVSYKREDRPRAKRIAETLEDNGFSVWWDRKIPPGKSFDQVIQQALDDASCVVVLWSEKSVLSDWVKEEAEAGADRGILMPILIDDVPVPLGFGRLQTANLVDWDGQSSHPGFDRVLSSISMLCKSPDSTFQLVVADLLMGPHGDGPEPGDGPEFGNDAELAVGAPLALAPIVIEPVVNMRRRSRAALFAVSITLLAAASVGVCVARPDLLPKFEQIASTQPSEAPRSIPTATTSTDRTTDIEPAPADTGLQPESSSKSSVEDAMAGGSSTEFSDVDFVGFETVDVVTPAPSSSSTTEQVTGFQYPAAIAGDATAIKDETVPEDETVTLGETVPKDEAILQGETVTPNDNTSQGEIEDTSSPRPAASALAAYRTLSQLQASDLDRDELLLAYETLWASSRQFLDSTAAARVLKTIDELKTPETAVADSQNLDVAQQMSPLRQANLERNSHSTQQPTTPSGDLASLTSSDKLVTCAQVHRGEGLPTAPVGVADEFQAGSVYMFAWVHAPQSRETLTLKWTRADGTIDHVRKVDVSRNVGSGYRIFYGRRHVDSGQYEVRLYNSADQLIGSRTYTVL